MPASPPKRSPPKRSPPSIRDPSDAAFWPELDLEPATQIASEQVFRPPSPAGESPNPPLNPRDLARDLARADHRGGGGPARNENGAETDPHAPEASRTFNLPTARRRLGSAILDGFLVVGTTVLLARSGAFGEAAANLNVLEPDDVGTKLVQGDLTLALVTFLVLLLCYSTFTHGYLGWSLGKLAFGLRVVTRRTGERPTPRRALLRAALSVPSLLFGCAGYLWPIISRRATCLHDLLSWTQVVRTT